MPKPGTLDARLVCSHEKHLALKTKGREAFRSATNYVGEQICNGVAELELRNCRDCPSTLSYPLPGFEHLYLKEIE